MDNSSIFIWLHFLGFLTGASLSGNIFDLKFLLGKLGPGHFCAPVPGEIVSCEILSMEVFENPIGRRLWNRPLGSPQYKGFKFLGSLKICRDV